MQPGQRTNRTRWRRPDDVPRRRRPDGAEARPARCEPRADLELARAGGGGGRAPGGLPGVRPLGLRLLQSRRKGSPTPSRSIARRCARLSRPASGIGASASSDCSSATATRLFNACVLAGPDGVVGTLSQGSSAVSGNRHVRRPRRPAVRRPRRGRAQGRHAHLLRRRFSRDRPAS